MKALRALVSLLLALACSVHAQILEVKKDAVIYEEPDRRSRPLQNIGLTDDIGIYTVRLMEPKTTKGYYKIKLRGREKTGWLYKSSVRRIESDQHPNKVAYQRTQYRHWIDADKNKINTRDEVLIRDAKPGTVKMDEAGKKVTSGKWLDPYTGQIFSDPRELDIDHFVPLKNAHESGGWTWSAKRKQLYANYLDDSLHLLPVKKSENASKSDRGPDEYLPPRKAYQCDYVATWVRIKQDWELEMTESETQAVKDMRKSCAKP